MFVQAVLPDHEKYALKPPPGCPRTPPNTYWLLKQPYMDSSVHPVTGLRKQLLSLPSVIFIQQQIIHVFTLANPMEPTPFTLVYMLMTSATLAHLTHVNASLRKN